MATPIGPATTTTPAYRIGRMSLFGNSPLGDLLSGDPQALAHFLAFAVAIVIAITVHEFAHAKSAQLAGDPTPGQHGRVTLNPLAHFDVIGTIALLVVGFGWGRPVPINPFLMRKPRLGSVLVSLWGPLSNFILALLFAIPLRAGLAGAYALVFHYLVYMNLVLGLFNLIPVHPLDGSHIVSGLLPPQSARQFDTFCQRYGLLVLILLFASRATLYLVALPASLGFLLLTGTGFLHGV